MVRPSPRSVPPVDQCPTEIFRSCRALSRRLAVLSCAAVIAAARKAPGSAPFSCSRLVMQKYANISRLCWLREPDSNRHLSNQTADRDRGDASGWKWAAVGKPDAAAARCKAASLRRSTKRQAGSSIAVPPQPKTRRSRPRPGHEKPAAEIRAGMARRQYFPNPAEWTSPVKRECKLSPDTFPPIKGKVALRRRTAPRPAVAASRRAKASPLDG